VELRRLLQQRRPARARRRLGLIVIEIRPLGPADVEAVDAVLPLHRLGRTGESTYLVAWDGDDPVGHAHVAWTETELGVPELQDFFVLPDRRNQGIGTQLTHAAEQLVTGRGHELCSISVSVANNGARRLYERLGYSVLDRPPKRIVGTIEIRGERQAVEDAILFLTKRLADPD
jgi:GNAT superfamily N-acetyltransferase